MGRVLVVGGAGYVGSTVTASLLERGHDVHVYDRLLFGDDALADFKGHPNFQVTVGDIRDIEAMQEAVVGAETVILTAALVGEKACDRDPRETESVNLIAPVSLAIAAKYYGVRRFVLASTDSVYGIQEGSIDEEAICQPASLYASLKIRLEDELRALSSPVFHPVILRKATVYGLSRRMRFDLILNILAAHAASTGTITIFGGEQWRPMVHVKDVARAYVLAVEMSLDKVAGQTFNVGCSSQNYQIGKLGELVRSVVPDVNIETIPEAPDLRDYHVNCDKIRDTLGFRVRQTCQDGIREVFDAVRSGHFGDLQDARYRNA